MLERLRLRLSVLTGRAGLWLLKRSGLYDGFFAPWRWALFDRAERMGLHVLPVHYYSPVPELGRIVLDDTTPRFVAAGSGTLEAALADLSGLVGRYGDAFRGIAARPPQGPGETVGEFRFGRAPYSTVEAEALYGLIRATRPARIVEIGCGHTTLLMAEAIRAEAADGYRPDYVCIEPYRPAYLETLPAEVSHFHDAPLQSVPAAIFGDLRAGDILFIDSSHVVSYGSDTVYEILTILPRLAPGVLVHFHDVFLPYEYPSDWLGTARFFWTEQYLLAAVLQGSDRFAIRYPLHQLYRERREALQALFPLLSDERHRPGAFWIEVAGAARPAGPGGTMPDGAI